MPRNVISVDPDIQNDAVTGTTAADRFVPDIDEAPSASQGLRFYEIEGFENGTDTIDFVELGILSLNDLVQNPIAENLGDFFNPIPGQVIGTGFRGTATNGDSFIITIEGLLPGDVTRDDFFFHGDNIVFPATVQNGAVAYQGTAGADIFVLEAGHRAYYIVDFEDGVDTIRANDLDVSNFSQFGDTAQNMSVGISVPDTTITSQVNQTINSAGNMDLSIEVYFEGATGVQTFLDASDFTFA